MSCTPQDHGFKGLCGAEILPGSFTCCVLVHIVGANLQFCLYQPSTLAVSSCVPPACLYLCHCVHICLSVALLVFKGPEFI